MTLSSTSTIILRHVCISLDLIGYSQIDLHPLEDCLPKERAGAGLQHLADLGFVAWRGAANFKGAPNLLI